MFLFFSCVFPSTEGSLFVFVLFVLSAYQTDMVFRPGFKEVCACGGEREFEGCKTWWAPVATVRAGTGEG